VTVNAKRPDAEKLDWFIDLLNAGLRPESPRLVAGQRLQLPDEKKLVKTSNWLRERPSPRRLRSAVAYVAGEIVTDLNLASPWRDSDETALRYLRSDQPPNFVFLGGHPARAVTKQAAFFELANRSAHQCSLQFEHDGSGKLLVLRVDGPPPSGPAAPLLVDAMNVLTYLVERGLHSRLKRCRGHLNALYRGAPPRLCWTWFECAANNKKQKFHDRACEMRTERQRNKHKYYDGMAQRREAAKLRDAEYYSKEGRSKAARPPVRSSATN
jgi:hypothetical protein